MLLSPKVLASIKNLPLLAKTVVDGFMMGAHKSFKKGAGMEFSQYRSYQPGDDLRQLDWKLFARSDRYYIRESETETSIAVRLILDASASMNHADEGITKIEYARYLAASLAYLANSLGDATGLYVLQQQELVTLTPRQEPQHLQRLFYQLTRIEPGGTFVRNDAIEAIFTNSRRKEMVIFITDMYQQAQEIYKLIARLKSYKNEVIVFHLMGQNEMELSYTGNTTFEDWETGQTVEVSPEEVRSQYKESLQQHLAQIRRQMLDLDIEYQLLLITQPLDQALRDFLVRRSKGARE
jgi:uncharacterized protein (DUF58 family)